MGTWENKPGLCTTQGEWEPCDSLSEEMGCVLLRVSSGSRVGNELVEARTAARADI